MSWSIYEYENDFVTITKENIDGIPSLKFRPKGYNGLLPTVILYHGWHSSKDFMRFKSLIIATNGYQVIVPDALYHGDRDPIDYDDPQSEKRYLWKIILQSVEESKEFIQTIINEHQADPMRIGITGSSMGTITAGGVFIANPNVKCLVGMNGAFSWQELIEKNCLEPSDPADKDLIEYYDPMNNGDKLNNRPILILHGIEDTSVSIESQRLFFNKMLPLYSDNLEKFQFEETSGIDHKITVGMIQETVTWFKKYL
jgi:uncharacterized protein